MKKLFTLVFLAAVGVVSMQAANIVSAGTGQWSAGATWVGGVVPTAADNVSIETGHTVTVSNDLAAISINDASLTSNVVTLTTAAAHGLAVGQPVIISGHSNAVFNGTFYITAVPTTTTFTYAKTNANITATGASGSIAPQRNLNGTLTLNGGTLAIATGTILTMSGSASSIVRASASGTVSQSGTGLFTVAQLSGQITTLNINVSCNSGNEGNNAASGKNHLIVASGVTYTMISSRQVDNVDLQGNIAGTSTFVLTVKGTITGTGSCNPKITINFSSGTQSISGATFNDFQFNANGNYTLTGSPTINGAFSVTKNTINVGAFTININGSLAASLTSTISNVALATNVATITTSAAHNLNSGAIITITGLASPNDVLNGTYTLTSASGSTMTFAKTNANITSTAASGTITAGIGTTSASSLVFGGSTAGVNIPSNITTLNNLTINNTSGVTLNSNMSIAGTLTLTAGTGAFNLNSNTLTMGGSSFLRGTGTITGNYTNPTGSTIAPGASAGTITVNGNLTNVGNVAIELGGATAGTGYDQILVSGTATLTSGTVTVSLINGYDPAYGATFVILDAASSTGAFTTISLPTLAGGKTWATPVYNDAAGTVTISVNVALPVELSNFNVKRNQTAALLTWTTASEKDNAVFNIEQSTNGTDFQTVGQVKGSGTTASATNYNFEHTTPSVGVNYYRLKQVDFNGAATLSAVKSVVFGKNGLVVKTTLVKDVLDVVVGDETATPLSIFNISGQQVLTVKAQGAQRLDVSALPSGLYVIRTAKGDTGRFVKQ